MKLAVMLPTYNEAGNIRAMISALLSLKLDMDIVVADDNSPDGTWRIVEEIGRKNKRVHLLLRKEMKGRGYAGREGFLACMRLKPDAVVEMDADFSHNPKYIPQMLAQLKNADVVLGSRYMAQAREERGDFFRRSLSEVARWYVNMLLGFRLTDPLSGFRCFRRKVLEHIDVPSLKSPDYFIVTEVLYHCVMKGFTVKEIPIIFEKRREGKSKLEGKMLMKYVTGVLKLRHRRG